MISLGGFCDARFEPLRDAFAASFDSGRELGAAVAVTHHGKLVVDLYGGYSNRKRTLPWEHDTIVNVFSTIKNALNLCVLMLVDQGELDVDEPLHTYWPEMNRDGKKKITVKHVLLHSAGLPAFVEPQPFETLQDWDRMIHLLEEEPLWFEPGTAQIYHAQTYGFLLGEVIRRISGEFPGQFFRSHVASPLALDLHMSLPESEDYRVAEMLESTSRDPSDFPPMAMKVLGSFHPGNWATRACRAAEIPAANGIGNARAIARMGAIFAMGGELEGVRLLSRATIAEAAREHTCEIDLAIEARVSRGLGFGRESPDFRGLSPDAFFWGGYGGSICAMDMEREISFAYTPNLLESMMGDTRGDMYARVLRPIVVSLDD